MNNNSVTIIELLKSTKRPGVDRLIDYMNDTGFFTAPCSSAHHLCKESGLAEHSLNVYRMMLNLYVDGTDINKHVGDISSVIIVAILHDLGKAGYRGKPNYVPNILKGGKQSEAKPYETNKDRLYVSHEIVSLIVAQQYIELTDEEEFAIMYHNGLYVASGRDINGKERPLQQLLHFCDMWCSRFVEKGKEEAAWEFPS
jgi:23S rRNA maturation-related 3'-5' exoribonuclease YhaM